MPTILCLFVLFAAASIAGEKELVLAERMREEYRREEKPIELPEVQAYVQQLGGDVLAQVHPDLLQKHPTPVGFRKRQERFEEEA